MKKPVIKKPVAGIPASPTGPNIWDKEMDTAEVHQRLKRIREYREWAQSMGLTHMVISKREVENLLLQAKQHPSLADRVIVEDDGLP